MAKSKEPSFNFGANRKPAKPRKKQGKRTWRDKRGRIREFGS